MNTYPNQKIIHVNKKKYTSNFLQIGVDEWEYAYKDLKPSTFAIYLYLASNADGFDLALSQKAIEDVLGIKKSSYHNAIAELESKGYITLMRGNIQSFFTTPVQKNGLQNFGLQENGLSSPKNWTNEFKKMDSLVQKSNIEIDNINNNINNINNENKDKEKEEKDKKEKLEFLDRQEEQFFLFEKDCYIKDGLSREAAIGAAYATILQAREEESLEDA